MWQQRPSLPMLARLESVLWVWPFDLLDIKSMTRTMYLLPRSWVFRIVAAAALLKDLQCLDLVILRLWMHQAITAVRTEGHTSYEYAVL